MQPIEAAARTFLLDSIEIGECMLIAAAICIVWALFSQVSAPETAGRGLHDTSTQPLRAAPRDDRCPVSMAWMRTCEGTSVAVRRLRA